MEWKVRGTPARIVSLDAHAPSVIADDNAAAGEGASVRGSERRTVDTTAHALREADGIGARANGRVFEDRRVATLGSPTCRDGSRELQCPRPWGPRRSGRSALSS